MSRVKDHFIEMLADNRDESFYLTEQEEKDMLLTIPDIVEQHAFLDEMYSNEISDIDFQTMYSEIETAAFITEHGREPNYKEMSQGW